MQSPVVLLVIVSKTSRTLPAPAVREIRWCSSCDSIGQWLVAPAERFVSRSDSRRPPQDEIARWRGAYVWSWVTRMRNAGLLVKVPNSETLPAGFRSRFPGGSSPADRGSLICPRDRDGAVADLRRADWDDCQSIAQTDHFSFSWLVEGGLRP